MVNNVAILSMQLFIESHIKNKIPTQTYNGIWQQFLINLNLYVYLGNDMEGKLKQK